MRNMAGSLLAMLRLEGRAEPYPWGPAEAAVGLALPPDYKELIDQTGAVIVDEWLCLFGPDPARPSSDIARLVRERDEAWEVLRGSGVALPDRFFGEGSRLVAFAAVEATYFFWHARDGVDPEDWPVVIVDDDVEDWYEFDLSATECIHQILVGEIELDPFEGLFGGGEHRAAPFPASGG